MSRRGSGKIKAGRAPSSFGGIHVKLPTVAPGQRIGLLGGSFNPAHEGHRNISLAALKRLNLDCIWWIVSPGNPLKSHGDLASFDDRVEHARKVSEHGRILVTDFEASLPTPFTSSTLAFLNARHKNVNFIWLMGADNLAQIHLWKNWRSIFDQVPVAVFDRPGYRHRARASVAAQSYSWALVDESDAAGLALMEAPAWTFLSVRLSAISSTELRNSR